jgi:hypothetical protein
MRNADGHYEYRFLAGRVRPKKLDDRIVVKREARGA